MPKHKGVVITKEQFAAALSLNARKAALARADKLSPERRREIAMLGVAARLAKKKVKAKEKTR